MTVTTGQRAWTRQYEKHEQDYQSYLAAPELQKQLKKLLLKPRSSMLSSQLHWLAQESAEWRGDSERLRQISSLWGELYYKLSSFRAELYGMKMDEQAVGRLLRSLKDGYLRKKVWYAAMKVGDQVAPGLIRLVKLRNEAAKAQGYTNYYEMKLKLQHTDPALPSELIRSLRNGLDQTYLAAKSRLDERLSETYQLQSEHLHSWHYAHPFVQTTGTPDSLKLSMDEHVGLRMGSWFDGRGLDLSSIMQQSDIQLRSGKPAANLCLHLDRAGDIRISCHLSMNQRGLSLLLHELGHAAYEQSIDRKLPFLLRQPAHPCLSEAAALLFERLAWDASWLQDMQLHTTAESDCPGFAVDELKAAHRDELLIRLYWTMTLVQFEQQLYERPEQDLNRLWWDTVEEIQQIRRPAEWNYPFWAAKAHLTTLPTQYYTYLFGEIAASQLQQELLKQHGHWLEENALRQLRQQVFSPGASVPWKELLPGAQLDPSSLIQELR